MNLTVTSMSLEMLPSTLYIMWRMQLHLQENTLFDLWPRSHDMLPSVLCITWSMHLQSLKLLRPTVTSRCIYKKIQYLTLTLVSNVTWDIAQCLLNHMARALCGIQRYRRRCVYMKIDYSTFELGRMKRCPVSYTSCDVNSRKCWSCYG